MTDNQQLGLRKVRRALLSVSDKTGIIEFASALKNFGVEIISTGGTARTLRDAGFDVFDVSDVTGFPEMMDGRIKTLHPKIHGALLGVRNNPEHEAAMREHSIQPIDLVVISLYPFQETIAHDGVTEDEAIEQIDIGGPAMIRSAAKNFRDVAVAVSPHFYAEIADELANNGGALTLAKRAYLATQAFFHTAAYDRSISIYFASRLQNATESASCPTIETASDHFSITRVDKLQAFTSTIEEHGFPPHLSLMVEKQTDLRYGENPHQKAALYTDDQNGGIAQAELLSGKEMSFNNFVDADAAWQLVSDFDERACAIIKHTNPAGVGLGASNEEAYRRALETDPVSAFGGIVAFNQKVDEAAAKAVVEIFTEVIVAPDYHSAALDILKTKKNLRVLRIPPTTGAAGLEYRQISGGMLIQTSDAHQRRADELKIVSKREPSEAELRALLFAWTVCKHTKSNAIVYARVGQTVGVGAGQMSRVDS
ncbi:MAG TPA: bifunctional phosphoribosylaminoimidazolecarboxamide formyltransferase/IMP cyclohydrolase, partial [Pyrinomonadaceae bacterium]|nr:bifunctional phosphoribosylaminoimidazolecarboxamide formyltransferase/IMP cyclohydrolase [Pyrinomonadaceae bacterium]